MERSSFFIKNKALFGSFPTQEAVYEFENKGVKYFIDLTSISEKKIIRYNTSYNYIHYPIVDYQVPTNWQSFSQFVIKICKIIISLTDDEKIYIHCRGGHGRSGLVVACILCYLFNITPQDALYKTSKYHSKRIVMRDKWRQIGSPQTRSQKLFVYKFFKPIYFNNTSKLGIISGFSNFSSHSVNILNLGIFPTSEAAIQVHKNLNNLHYINSQKNSSSPLMSKYMGKQVILRKDWDEVKNKITENVIKLKLQQNESISSKIINTGLRPLIEYKEKNENENDFTIKNNNELGKILMKIRDELYETCIT